MDGNLTPNKTLDFYQMFVLPVNGLKSLHVEWILNSLKGLEWKELLLH